MVLSVLLFSVFSLQPASSNYEDESINANPDATTSTLTIIQSEKPSSYFVKPRVAPPKAKLKGKSKSSRKKQTGKTKKKKSLTKPRSKNKVKTSTKIKKQNSSKNKKLRKSPYTKRKTR